MSYTFKNPIKQTKHMPLPTINNYALILLKVAQDINNGQPTEYTKKELVASSIGHIERKFQDWPWTDSAFCKEFSMFNEMYLLRYDIKKKKWRPGIQLMEYLRYYFGPYTKIPLKLETNPYDEALLWNRKATIAFDEKRKIYHKIKEYGKEYFFQTP